MINPISDSSFVKYLEYIDDVVEVNRGRRRNILNKKKKAAKLHKNTLPDK